MSITVVVYLAAVVTV